MDILMNNSQKPNSLRKVCCNKEMCIDKISITRLNFKSIRNYGQEYFNKLKSLPKIQRSAYNTYICARKIFVNGVMKSSESMTNTMKTRYQYHRAFTLQEEADKQEWTRYLLYCATVQKFDKYNFSQKVDKK